MTDGGWWAQARAWLNAALQTGLGATLTSALFWNDVLHAISVAAEAVASITGAIIGLHGVWRIFRRKNTRAGERAAKGART